MYYESIIAKNLRDVKLRTISNAIAFGYAYGSIKKKNFDDFIESLETDEKEIDVNKTLRNMKKFGLPVEEK